MTVEIQKNKDDNILMQSVITIQKQDKQFTKKGSTERKFRNKIKRVCEEDDWYLDKDRPFERSCRKGKKDENIVVTSYHIIFKGKFLHVVQWIWWELDAKVRYFVVAYNREVKHNKSTYEIDVSANFQALFKDKSSTPRYSTLREN